VCSSLRPPTIWNSAGGCSTAVARLEEIPGVEAAAVSQALPAPVERTVVFRR